MGNKNAPQVFDLNMKRVCYLDKAIKIGYRQVYNGLWTARFTLPADDIKNEYCKPFHYVEIYDNEKRVELFRIIPSKLSRAKDGYITYYCEHVIATLIDNVLFKYHEIGNKGVYTSDVIQYVLSKQKTKNWKLGTCGFKREFLYKWENENPCSALFSIPKPFVDDYHFTYDTTRYPWTVNLVKAETSIGCEIRYRKNMQHIEKNVDPSNLVTRLYPLGYGEGDNQLSIDNINGGVPYIEADTINDYGLKESIWVDRRFQVAENLKATAESMLNELKKPYVSYYVNAIDLFQKTSQDFDEFREGKLVRVIDKEDNINFTTKIVEIDKTDITKAQINITIANKDRDVASSIANLQERTRINETYAQGSATLMTIPYIDNADKDNPALFEFYLPSSMININKALFRIKLQPFRGYTRAIKGGGDSVSSTSSGGNTVESTSHGGAITTSTANGGELVRSTEVGGNSTESTLSGGGDTITASQDNTYEVWRVASGYVQAPVMSSAGDPAHIHYLVPHVHEHSHSVIIKPHVHTVYLPSHSHLINIPFHTHVVTIPSHTHSVTIPSHAHIVTIPPHVHDIEFGIFQGPMADKVDIFVDGTKIEDAVNYDEIDVIKYLSIDGGGKIRRDTWHKIEVVPSDLTRISAYLFLYIFTNSRGGGDY